MKLYFALAIVFAVILNGLACEHLVSQDAKKVIDLQVENKFNVGAVLGVVHKGSEELLTFGVTDLDLGKNPTDWRLKRKSLTGKNPTGDHLYDLGSVSKVFTGILLASLVHSGDVKLDDPVSKFIKELKGSKTGAITLIELSTHTSGLPSVPNNLVSTDPSAPYAGYTAKRMIEFLKGYDLKQRPIPFHWKNYSNLGVGLLGYVLTQARDKDCTYDDLLKEFITGPLRMDNTVSKMSEAQLEMYATPYNAVLEKQKLQDFGVLIGNGAIRSTANDMMTFIKANLDPDSTEIGDALKLAQQIHRTTNEENNIGLGWGIDYVNDEKNHYHAGGTGSFTSYVTFDKSRELGYVVLTNTGNVIPCLREIIMKGEKCLPDLGVEVPVETLAKYVGKYNDEATGFQLEIGLKFNFLTYDSGREKGRLTAVNSKRFTILKVVFMEFVKNENGVVTHLVFEQGAMKFTLKKVTN